MRIWVRIVWQAGSALYHICDVESGALIVQLLAFLFFFGYWISRFSLYRSFQGRNLFANASDLAKDRTLALLQIGPGRGVGTMSMPGDTYARSPFAHGSSQIGGQRALPILPSSTQSSQSPQGDPMDVTLPTPAMMAPPVHSSPDMDQGGSSTSNGVGEVHSNNMLSGPVLGASAAAAAQQPKVVQTAFIHKLYKYVVGRTSPLIRCADSSKHVGRSPHSASHLVVHHK